MKGCDIRVKSLIFLVVAVLEASGASAASDEEYEVRKWEEQEISLPAAPKAENLLPFYVSATADNRFFVDAASLSVGADGVVRYTLVVETPSRVRNVSFEGMRCETRERRLYAFGRNDGSWSKARSNRWERIMDVSPLNRYHAALFLEYFCPTGVIVGTADEARDALRQGGHPSLKRRN